MKTTIIKIDFYVQALLVAAWLVLLVSTLFGSKLIFIALMVQFGLGCWQLGGSLIGVLARGASSSRFRHLVYSVLYLGFLWLFYSSDPFSEYSEPALWIITLVAPPLLLAGCSLRTAYLAWKATQAPRGFLSRIQF
jgi:hypothetical protein